MKGSSLLLLCLLLLVLTVNADDSLMAKETTIDGDTAKSIVSLTTNDEADNLKELSGGEEESSGKNADKVRPAE